MTALVLRFAGEIVASILIVATVGCVLQVWAWINCWWESAVDPTIYRGRWTAPRISGRINKFAAALRIRSSDWGFVLGYAIILGVLLAGVLGGF